MLAVTSIASSSVEFIFDGTSIATSKDHNSLILIAIEDHSDQCHLFMVLPILLSCFVHGIDGAALSQLRRIDLEFSSQHGTCPSIR